MSAGTTCYEFIRDVEHHDFWVSSLGFSMSYTCFLILSTVTEAWIGHFIPLEVAARLAVKWPDLGAQRIRMVAASPHPQMLHSTCR